MKKLYCTNFFKALCSMVVMLALVAGITAIPAYAAFTQPPPLRTTETPSQAKLRTQAVKIPKFSVSQ